MSFINSVFLYVFISLGFYCICRRRPGCKAYTAWLPFVRWMAMGRLIGTVNINGRRVAGKKLASLYIFISAILTLAAAAYFSVYMLTGGVALDGLHVYMMMFALIALAGDIVFYIMLYHFYCRLLPGNEALMLTVSILIPFAPPVFIMVMGLAYGTEIKENIKKII